MRSAGVRGPLAGLALVSLVVAACGRAVPGPDVVLSLEGEAVSYAAFDAFLASQVGGEEAAALPSDVLSGLFDQFVDQRLLERWARDQGLGDGEAAPLEALVESLEVPAPTPTAVEAVYEASPDRFTRPLRVRLRQILLADEADARRALEELRGGAEFDAVAERLAPPPYRPVGGDEGIVSRGDVPAAFGEIVFSLGEGEISDVVRADYGFHIFQVVERLPEERLSLAEATPEIRRELERRAADRQLDALVERAAERYNVEVHARNLPFQYRGRYGRAPVPSSGP